MMYDLRKYGIPNGQIMVGGHFVSTNWNPSLPSGTGLALATYCQTMFDGRVEFRIGYLQNGLDYLGTQVGGNLAGGIFGVSASIGPETGESIQTVPTPGANLKINLPNSFYTKFGVSRALSPDGVVAERNVNRSQPTTEAPAAL